VRTAVTVVALALIGALGLLTVFVLVAEGPDLLTAISVVVVAVLAFGVFGALREL
jgi:hypothetical protein